MTARPMNCCEEIVEAGEPALLSLRSHDRAGEVVIEVRGEVDLATAPVFERALAEALDQRGQRDVVVDLRAVDFMSSTGLSVLLNARTEALRDGGRALMLASPSPLVTRVLEFAGLLSSFVICDGVTDDPAPA